MFTATLKIDLHINTYNGRSFTIPKGSVVQVEERGSHMNLIYNDNNIRMSSERMCSYLDFSTNPC